MLVCVAAAIGAAAPAYADFDGSDQVFLAALKQAGLTYQDPERAVTVGRTVCNLVDEGMTGVEIVKNLQELNPGFVENGAAQFTAIAASAYCPKSLTSVDQPAGPKSGGR